jgi:cysteinyl-tRNA synthetase
VPAQSYGNPVIRLHDTAFGRAAEVELRDAGKVSMYACGPTVDNVPHIGHGRMVLVFDVLRRYLEWTGLDVRFVSNITDIDDKIIRRGNQEGRPSTEVALQYEAAWYDAVDRLGVKRPTVDPHATAYVEQMVELIAGLVAGGKAYETSDGVYLSVDSVPGYGLLARQPLDSLRSGARIEVGEEKKSPLDFALWKKAKPDEPTWPSPWGEGRPGWHTECVVMSLDLLGEGFDLHGGGIDLAFPHHENERAQAVAGGKEFARRWAHNGHVQMGGEKMSKSLGNIRTLTDLLDAVDPRAYRLVVLQSHYRAPVEVTGSTLEQATNTLAGLDAFARRVADLPAGAADEGALDRFRSAMDDDLDTPRAMAELAGLVRAANTALDARDTPAAAPLAAAVGEMTAAVGLALSAGGGDVPPEVTALVAEREQARAARDFAASDALRERLDRLGWVVEDTPRGTRVHRKDT